MPWSTISWHETIFRYCERGGDPGLWAEPLNAVSNLAFLVAAAANGIALWRQPNGIGQGHEKIVPWLLIALATGIGIGSLAFHMMATRASQLADVLPIGLFMLVYFAFALRVMLGWSILGSGVALAVYCISLAASARPACQPAGPGLDAASMLPGWCFNGSLGYGPALVALLTVGARLCWRAHPAAVQLLLAAGVFLLSLALRSVDRAVCPLLTIGPFAITTHALWHLANAGVVHLLLAAAVKSAETASNPAVAPARRINGF